MMSDLFEVTKPFSKATDDKKGPAPYNKKALERALAKMPLEPVEKQDFRI